MKNKLMDLNNYMFESIERLMQDDLTDEDFEKERKRADQVCKTAKVIIDNGRLILDAMEYAQEYGISGEREMNYFLEDKNGSQVEQSRKG